MPEKAKFLYFKSTGKFYTSGEGVLPDDMWDMHGNEEWRAAILRANQNHMPGLSTTGSNFIVVVLPGDETERGYPLHLNIIDED